MKNRKTIPIFISIILFITNIFNFSLVAYAEPTLDEDGHLHVYNWEDIKEVAPKFVYYLCAQASSIVSGDFYNYVSNQDAWESMWNENNISISEDGTSVIASPDLTAYIKQALVEYNEETCGYTILQTIPYNYITPPLFYRKTEYDAYRAMIENCEMFSIGGVSGPSCALIYFVDLSPYYEENLQAVAYYGINYNSKNCIVQFYRENWTYYGFGINAYSFDKNGILQEDSDGDRWNGDYAKLFILEKGEISTFSSLPYSSYNGHYWYVFSKDGRRIRVWNSLDAMKYGTTGTRSVYFGSDFYNEPTEITVSFDELANFDTTKIENLLTDIKKELGQEVDTLTEAEIEKAVDDALGKYFEELKDVIQNLPTDSDKEESGSTEIVVNTDKDFFSEWFQKIIDKLEEVKEAVNGLLAENLINDIISFLDDGKDDAIDNATDIIGELIDTFDDEIDKDDIGAADMVQALSGTAGKLKDKFPFSLPWDVFFLVSLLEAEPEAPKIKLPIVLERYGIEEYIEIDMSKFEVLSEICRGMLTITYAYGLLNLTYKVINIGKEE